MATHSSILAWKILWMEETGRLQSIGSQRVGHDWATSLFTLYTIGTNYTSAAAAKLLQSCPTLCDPRGDSPPGSPSPWDSPGKNTGVGCHFLLQCMKVKSESEVVQPCPTLSDPMDCSLPGSSVHGIFQARVLEWGAIAFSNYTSSVEEYGKQGFLRSSESFQCSCIFSLFYNILNRVLNL